MELPIHKRPSFHPDDNVVKKRVDSGFGPGFVKFRDAKGNIQIGCYFCGEEYGRIKQVDRIDRHMILSHFRSLKDNWLITDEALAEFKRSLPQYICSLCEHLPFYRTDGYSMHMRKIHKYPLTWKPTRDPTKHSTGIQLKCDDSHDESSDEDEQDATERSELDGVHRVIDEDYDGDEPSDTDNRPIGTHRPMDEDYDGDEDEQEAVAQYGVPESCNSADEPELPPMEVIQGDETLLNDSDQMEVVEDRMEHPSRWAPVLGTRGRLSATEQEELDDVEDDQLDPGEYEPSDGEDVRMSSCSDAENRRPGPPLLSVFARMARPGVLASRTIPAGRLSSTQGPSESPPLSSESLHAQKLFVLSQKDGQVNPETADRSMRGRSVYKPKGAGQSKLQIDIQPHGAGQDAALSAPPHASRFDRHVRMLSMPPPIRFSPARRPEATDALQQKRFPSGEVGHQDTKRPRIDIPLPSASSRGFSDTYAREMSGLMSVEAETMQVIRRPAVLLPSADVVTMDMRELALRENLDNTSLLPLCHITRGVVPYGAWVSMGAQGRPVFIPLSILQHGIDAFRTSTADAIFDSDIALYVRALSSVQRLALADFVEKTIRGQISDVDFLRRLGH